MSKPLKTPDLYEIVYSSKYEFQITTKQQRKNNETHWRKCDSKLNELIIGVANVSSGWDCNAP